jgi:hypothetical protein
METDPSENLDPIAAMLSAPQAPYEGKKPSPDATYDFDEPAAPEGASELPPKHLLGALSRLNRRVIDVGYKPEPIFSLNGHIWATEGNFSTFSALSKAGKSACTGGMIASALCGEGDTLGFSSGNPKKGALICIDTEQSDYHHDKKLLAAIGRKGYDEKTIPDWIAPYALAGESLDLNWLEAIMWREDARCGGIHAVILDGVADLVRNVNDPAEADLITAGLIRLAKKYKTHIIAVIHINPGGADSGKTRGHLGSTLERKAETNLTIKVTERDRVVYARNARDCDIPESKGTRFAWSDVDGTFITSAGGDCGGFDYLDLLEYLAGGDASKTCAKKAFQERSGISAKTVDRAISKLVKDKLVDEFGLKNTRKLSITPDGVAHLKFKGRLDNPPTKE